VFFILTFGCVLHCVVSLLRGRKLKVGKGVPLQCHRHFGIKNTYLGAEVYPIRTEYSKVAAHT